MRRLKKVIWERKIAWQQSQDVYKLQKTKEELVAQNLPSVEITKKLLQVPLNGLDRKSGAVIAGVKVEDLKDYVLQEEMKGVRSKRAKRGTFGYMKRDINRKKTSWFVV